ncbi:hypothetical protein FKN04_22910 [Bacillus glycinifermentans]|uniref:hypothetical protein n=1 Tax=Bacillus TaxID=1386 RepID=UPI0015822DFA|nr:MULTISPECIES: hypothetical protein [Bacillus]NUJ19384.1 hypothetical protein [Bacillus glycinifermentans]GIN67122.1 hypothetical protein J41TS2_25430 [Bacillus sonorensis]
MEEELNRLKTELDKIEKRLESALKAIDSSKEYIAYLENENNLLYGRLNNIVNLASKEIK